MTVRRSLLVVSLWLSGACSGDDGVHHLPDGPPSADAAIDSPSDSPGETAVELRITIAGTGSGTITSTPAGITCGATCASSFARDTVITLTAEPATGSVFTAWGGACSGTSPTCEVTLANAAAATATFTLATYTVTVTRPGPGSGTVSGGPISCGTTCMVTVDYGTTFTLTATPATLSTFAGWGGACSGTATCPLTITSNTTVTGNFSLGDVTLFVTRGGNGTGTVTSSPLGISCGVDCQETYPAGQVTMLTAAAATGSTFTGWSGGGCSGVGTCTVTMTAATTVTATFTLNSYPLVVTRNGTGSGAVTSTPGGIACGIDCSGTYVHGSVVVLAASASTGSTFAGWTGACTGTGACTVTMDMARAVTATFTLDTFTLATSTTGSGAITGPGINCPGTCNAIYNYNTVVTLTATPATGSTFSGWSGACTGTGACMVTMDMARSVSATFTLNTYTLTAATIGSGAVTGTGINCPGDCMEVFGYGTIVTLGQTAAVGSSFAGWSGACTGTGACVVTIDMAKSVTATFTVNSYVLTVSTLGNGSGTVTGTGITCGTACSQSYVYGTSVTLSATAATGSTFVGWAGACTGTGACVVAMDMAKSVSATFQLNTYVLSVGGTGTGFGTITGTGITCGTDCTETLAYNTIVTLTATPGTTPATASKFIGWSGGGCSGTGTCTVTITDATTVTANFQLMPNVMFTTSTLQNGNLGGLAGADALCQQRAQAANLRGTFRAYLSSLSGNFQITAASRMGGASGWIRVDGVAVMNDITQLANGTAFNAPLLTETGSDVGQTQFPFAWTGTAPGGNFDTACSAAAAFVPWGGATGIGTIGNATVTTTAVVSQSTSNCDTMLRLYCLGVDRAAIVQ